MREKEDFYRKVHLDGHLSPLIDDIGGKFDKLDFQKKLKDNEVSAITLFAKCHHGYTYYPSQVGKMHPNLNFDLLGSQIQAAHEIGVKANIYITLGWSNYDFQEHKNWASYSFETKKIANNFYNFDAVSGEKIPDACWVNLCPTGEYLEYLKELTAEICERYKPVDGIFYDICLLGTSCVCPSCVKGMIKEGLDPQNKDDAETYFMSNRIKMMSSLNEIILSSNSEATIFYNGSAVVKNGKIDYAPYHKFDTHFEMEELPTTEGNYDRSCINVKCLEKSNKPILGMTGKFHLGWGEFGGFKTATALRYETAYASSLGIGICVGDQLHPSGLLDDETYKIIGESFRYFKSLEKICFPSQCIADIGIVLSEKNSVNDGLNILLQELQTDYLIMDGNSEFDEINCLIVPENPLLTENLLKKINDYIARGGKIICVGNAVKFLNLDGVELIGKSQYDVDYLIDDAVGLSPVVMYSSAYIIKARDYKTLSEIREPYFNRTYEHYCSHLHSPNNDIKVNYFGAAKKDNIIIIAHDIFSEYTNYGQVYLRNYFKKFLNIAYPERLLEINGLMSSGRARLRKNTESQKYLLHLLYAPILKHGKAYLIDDIPLLKDIAVKVKLTNIKSVKLQPQNIELPFKIENGYVVFTVPTLLCHQVITLY